MNSTQAVTLYSVVAHVDRPVRWYLQAEKAGQKSVRAQLNNKLLERTTTYFKKTSLIQKMLQPDLAEA